MSFASAAVEELREQSSLPFLAIVLVLLALSRTLPASHRERVRGSVVLTGLHFLLVLVASVLHWTDSAFHREARLSGVILAALAVIGLAGTLLFSGLLPRVRVQVPRILQDVIIAGASLVAIFMLSSRAGLNLSGLVATSAILTAVIGLAFQDTLGNVVGGLALQLDDSIAVGDWVKVGDVAGRVVDIRWRHTAIETRNWETVIVPNSVLVKNQVLVLGRRSGRPLQWRRWIYFNVDFRYSPTDVVGSVVAAIRGVPIPNVSNDPPPDCLLMDLHESYGRYAVRYWLTDLAADDPTDSIFRTRIYFALRRAEIPLSIPAHAVFLTNDSSERREQKSRAEIERRLRALGRVELFAALADEERQHLAEHLHYAPFAPNELVTRQGAEAHWLYMIIEGEVSVRVAAEGGVEREVARLHAGDFFGEMSLLTGARRAATVVALSEVECYRLDKEAFQALLAARPEVAEHIADTLAQRRVELASAQSSAGDEADERLRATRTDLLDKIRNFFSLDGGG